MIKLIENSPRTAEKLRIEFDRYGDIRDKLPPIGHAQPIAFHEPRSAAAPCHILWSEFIDDHATGGLPLQPPTELRHIMERNQWQNAAAALRATYEMLQTAHTGRFASVCYIRHYGRYLRADKGWQPRLRSVVGSSRTLEVLGVRVRNPLATLTILQGNRALTTAPAHLSAVHGDLHPKNVLVGGVRKTCLIDFGWACDSFHTVVDYAFMEASIKFFRLPWHCSRSELVAFEKGLCDTSGLDLIPRNRTLRGGLTTVTMIRNLAVKYMDSNDEQWFVRQYLVPLFLITCGLFPYAATVTNLEHLLLSAGLLAERIERLL